MVRKKWNKNVFIYKSMSSVSKNVYIDKLDDIVNKYNNTNHNTIKMKPVYVKSYTYINFDKDTNSKDPKFKIGLKKFLWIKKFKILCLGHILLVILKKKKLLEHFMRKNCKTKIKKKLELKK